MLKARNSIIKVKDCLINLVFTFLSTIGLNYLLGFVIGPFVIMSIIYKLLYTMGILSKHYYLHSRLARLDKMLYGLVLGEILFMIFYYVIIRVKNKGDKSKIISSFNLNKLKLKQIGFYIAFAMITSGIYAFKEIKVYRLGDFLIGEYKNLNEKFIKQDKNIIKKRTIASFVFEILNQIIGGYMLYMIVKSAYIGEILLGNTVAYIRSISNVKGSVEF